jgi:hypothetical protein
MTVKLLGEREVEILTDFYDPDELVDILGITVPELAAAFPEKVAAFVADGTIDVSRQNDDELGGD